MKVKCKETDCDAPKAFCKKNLSPHYQECEIWRSGSIATVAEKNKTNDGTAIPWTGLELTPSTIDLLTHRSAPLIIGLVGAANAGKTSFLGMLYTLLFNGRQFSRWRFAGSYTLIAWESQAKGLKIQPNGKVPFPQSTPAQPDYYSLYHLALKKEKRLYDVLFADSSGEVFTKWAAETDNSEAENAKWIYDNSDSFIFFVDCEALIKGRGRARSALLQLAGQVSANLNGRKVVIVWSKADKIADVPLTIKDAVESLLENSFPNAPTFFISNFSSSPQDELCYVNNLAAAERVFDEMTSINRLSITPRLPESSDFFFNYHGSKSK